MGSDIPFRSDSVGVVTNASQLTVAATVLVVRGPNSNPANGDGFAGSFSGVLAGVGAPNWKVLEAGVLPKLNDGGAAAAGAAFPNEKVVAGVAVGAADLFPKLKAAGPAPVAHPKEKEGTAAGAASAPGATAGALGLAV